VKVVANPKESELAKDAQEFFPQPATQVLLLPPKNGREKKTNVSGNRAVVLKLRLKAD
jgi:hypothetical protein